MKEKIMAVTTLGFIFSLFFYYKVINPMAEATPSLSDVNNPIIGHVQKNVENQEGIDIVSSIPITIESQSFEQQDCDLNNDETNQLKFSDAFKYYRQCNEENKLFVWNNNIYTTLLKSEVKNDNLLTDKKNHLKVQNQLVGDNQK